MVEDRILQEAIGAIEKGQRARARDLLTRILRQEPARADCWLYMSAVVETEKERAFCLENALKYDPKNETARHGLVMLGKLPPDESYQPVRPVNERQKVDPKLFEPEPEEKDKGKRKKRRSSPARQLVPTVIVGLIAISLVVVGIFGNPFAPGRSLGPSLPTSTFAPLAAAAGPTPTRYMTQTPESEGLVSEVILPTPLTIRLEETYTPTPMYVNTPHPNNEAFAAAMRSLDSENYGAALGLFEQARSQLRETNSSDLDVRYYIGLIYLKTGQYEDARREFELILQQDSLFAPAYLGRAQAILSMKADSVVAGDLYRVIAIDPEYAEGYLAIATYRINRREFEEALRILEELLEFEPDNARGLNLKAEVLMTMGEYEEALEAARRAFELNMTFEDNYLTLGRALVLNGFEREAYGYLELYLRDETHQEDRLALYMMGRALQGYNDHIRAVDHFERSYAIRKDQYEMSLYWAESLVAIGEYEAALERVNVPLQQIPNWFDPYLVQAQAYFYLEDYAEAKEVIETGADLVETTRQRADLFYWRGLIYEELGYPLIALSNWEELLQMGPGEAPIEYLREAQKRVQPELPTFTPEILTPTRVNSGTSVPSQTPTPGNTPTPTP